MANVERVKKAIRVMERVWDRADRFDMTDWQRHGRSECCKTEQKLQECGMAACFGGWLAVSPEFQEDGGRVTNEGLPFYGEDAGSHAIARYLGIHVGEAEFLCALTESLAKLFYGVPRTEVTPQMVINKLQELINRG